MNLASCSTIPPGSGGAVTKVKVYNLDPTERLKVQNAPIRFERQSRLYGAVTREEQLNRAGQYYTAFWKVNDRSQPVTVRFEYRQRDTSMEVHSLVQEVSDVRRTNVTEFQVTGEAFHTNGPVTAWRVLVLRGKEQLASAESFLWK